MPMMTSDRRRIGGGALLAEDVGQHEQRDEGADHEHVAMREVDELDDAVDHRVARGR